MRLLPITILGLLLLSNDAFPQKSNDVAATGAKGGAVCGPCIRANLEYLASDQMRGRGSGTEDEHRAAIYIADTLRRYGIPPAIGRNHIQQANVIRRTPVGPGQLKFRDPKNSEITWTHGEEILVLNLAHVEVSGSLQKISSLKEKPPVKPGAMVFLQTAEEENLRSNVQQLLEQGAGAVLVPETPRWRSQWEARGRRLLHLPTELEGSQKAGLGDRDNIVVISHAAEQILNSVADGSAIQIKVPTSPPEISHTWNVVGILHGTDADASARAILLSAHFDHLGVGEAVNGDNIYNGADDDASGVVAVLELARVLGARQRPRRTVIFALFGSEELGGVGAAYFREHPPVPLKDIAANLEFEMIGRADPAVAADTLWLTGWEKSNLGPELAAHGAKLVGDPHPEENFFVRSDNYVLARQGVVAQTVSSYGLHKDYHRPSDDISHIDFTHMNTAIGSLLGPVEWLVNSEFVPKWKDGFPTSDAKRQP